MTSYVVEWLGLPPGSPYSRGVALMFLTSLVAALAALVSVFLKLTRDARVVQLLRNAEASDRNVRDVLAVLKQRILQTTEHRDDAQETLKRVVQETAITKETVEARSDEIVAAVQQLTCAQPPPGRVAAPPDAGGDKGDACGS